MHWIASSEIAQPNFTTTFCAAKCCTLFGEDLHLNELKFCLFKDKVLKWQLASQWGFGMSLGL